MRYVSVCSGIEAATVAWHHMGWQPAWFSEIEPFPSAVLRHHYPDTRNMGDMTKYGEWPDEPVDLLVGGTPCQSFSVAGLRAGLADPRGGLMLTYLEIARRYRPRWIVWENVPGVLSSNGGRDFGSFLGALGQLGYGWAYRVLDAQWFGVAQRRRRVFVVGYLGDGHRPAKVLFERESVRRDTPPSREKRQTIAATAGTSIEEPIAFDWQSGGDSRGLDPKDTAQLQKSQVPAVFAYDMQNDAINDAIFSTLQAEGQRKINRGAGIVSAMQVRRLTPTECERLQGFPDGYTNIPWRKKPESPDGPRYKALGNSMAVPVMRWIGERINGVDNE